MRAHNAKLVLRTSKHELGLTLVELIVSIVVIGVSVAGILLALVTTLRGSADPLVAKQALAIAEALLEEVELMPFTYCDPDDPNAATATSTADCTSGMSEDVLAPQASESRTSATNPFDNVGNYNGYNTSSDGGIKDITGAPIGGLDAYQATITVAQQGIPTVGGNPEIPAADALLITVNVSGPGNAKVSLQGYRTRHAPNALP